MGALDATIVAVWDWLRIPAALILLMGLLSAVYTVAAGDRPPLRRLLPGAGLAAALWTLVSVAFPFALSTMLHYGATYGSFSAAIVMLVYLYLLAASVLLGAEVNGALITGGTFGDVTSPVAGMTNMASSIAHADHARYLRYAAPYNFSAAGIAAVLYVLVGLIA